MKGAPVAPDITDTHVVNQEYNNIALFQAGANILVGHLVGPRQPPTMIPKVSAANGDIEGPPLAPDHGAKGPVPLQHAGMCTWQWEFPVKGLLYIEISSRLIQLSVCHTSWALWHKTSRGYTEVC